MLEGKINSSAMLFFKVINPYHLEYQSAIDSSSFQSYLEELEDEGNLNLNQKYFDILLLFSNKTLTEIEFEIFISFNKFFRRTSFFNNVEEIQQHFIETYKLPFFFQGEFLTHNSDWEKIERSITYDDFEKVIIKNLNIKLVKPIEYNQIVSNSIIYNWDFFEDLDSCPSKRNVLFENISHFPISDASKGSSSFNSRVIALATLFEVAHNGYYKLRGFRIPKYIIEEAKINIEEILYFETVSSESSFSINEGYIDIFPTFRDFINFQKDNFKNEDFEFIKDFEKLMGNFKNYLLPFYIKDTYFLSWQNS
jgi:hypothetical protein